MLNAQTVLRAEGKESDPPATFVATSTKRPRAVALTDIGKVALVPAALTIAPAVAIGGGCSAGKKAKLAPVRFEPLTWIAAGGRLTSIVVGATAVITGTASSLKLVGVVTV